MSMDYGAWNKLPHYSVVGTNTSFYVWVNDGLTATASNWIKGRIASEEYNKLKLLHGKDKRQFIILVKELHSKFAPKKRK